MTDKEKRDAKKQITEILNDLEEFDPGDPEREGAENRAENRAEL